MLINTKNQTKDDFNNLRSQFTNMTRKTGTFFNIPIKYVMRTLKTLTNYHSLKMNWRYKFKNVIRPIKIRYKFLGIICHH